MHNDLSKAQAQVETGAGSKSNAPKPGQGDKGNALKPGSNPNEKGASQQPDAMAQGNIPLPRPDASAKGQVPSGGTKGGKNEKGGHGDTHLGEFPVAENFPRFYKPGEGPRDRNSRRALRAVPPADRGGLRQRRQTSPRHQPAHRERSVRQRPAQGRAA